jgi:hypothetical protein
LDISRDDTIEPKSKNPALEMNMLYHQERQAGLVQFCADASDECGWWYMSPINTMKIQSTMKKNKKDNTLSPINIFPHFGTIFGFSNDATLVLISEMGLIRKKKDNYINHRDAWERLKNNKDTATAILMLFCFVLNFNHICQMHFHCSGEVVK